MDRICPGQSVLIVWRAADSEALEKLADEVRRRSAKPPQLEHADRLHAATAAAQSVWDVVLVTADAQPSDEVLARVLGLLVPRGAALLATASSADLTSRLTLAGYVNCASVGDYCIAEKPNFEVGSRSALRAPGAVWRLQEEETVEAAWGTAGAGAGAGDLIDADMLLDQEDLKKPDKESLKVCATTGRRKACADCSCGLAEELRGTGTAAAAGAPASSCGSCYLGDAFRCSSCPYLGLPAFKPGERVLLGDLTADV